MVQQKQILKSIFILVVLFMISGSCGHIRNLLWDDPYCNTFSVDGKCCLKCSYHYWMDKYGRCQPVSDWCKTWDESTGSCKSCFLGYGTPVNGVCASSPVIGGSNNSGDNNCDNSQSENTEGQDWNDNCKCYGYEDENKKFYKSWFKGCRKVCIQCKEGFYLNYVYQCIGLPRNCKEADMYGNCTDCIDGYHEEKGLCVPNTEDNCAEYGYMDIAQSWSPIWINGCRKVCKQCRDGFYLNYNFQCFSLPDYCNVADDHGYCIQCFWDYKNQNGRCFAVNDHCDEYAFLDASNKRCYSIWEKGCKKVCQSCITGYYLNQHDICLQLPPHCLDANSTGACTSCVSGYHVENALCIDDYHCAEWGYLDGAQKWWPTWIHGSKKVCKCCYDGFYLNFNNLCVPLPSKCTAANFSGACTSCISGYHVENRFCVKNDDNCAEWGYLDGTRKWWPIQVNGCKKVCKCCEFGYYLNFDKLCVALPTGCLQAQANGACKKCCDEYDLTNGVCILKEKKNLSCHATANK